jgi:hypothetical protein
MGLYVDGASRINTGPFKFRAKDAKEIIDFLDVMVSLLKLDKDQCYSTIMDDQTMQLMNKAGEIAKEAVKENISFKEYKKRIKKEVEKMEQDGQIVPPPPLSSTSQEQPVR